MIAAMCLLQKMGRNQLSPIHIQSHVSEEMRAMDYHSRPVTYVKR